MPQIIYSGRHLCSLGAITLAAADADFWLTSCHACRRLAASRRLGLDSLLSPDRGDPALRRQRLGSRRCKRTVFISALVSICTSQLAPAEWRVLTSKYEPANVARIEHRTLELEDTAADAQATVHLVFFSPKTATLRVIDNPQSSDSLAEAMQRENCLAGVNGGYFDPNYAPVGLMISDGRLIGPQQKARLLSGVVSATKDRVLVQRAGEFSMRAKPSAARQCGPFLVDRGQPVPGLNNERVARRTFVALMGPNRVAIGCCTSVTLAQLAALLVAPDLKMQRAMNLDGGSSTGFWFAGGKGAFSIPEQKTVRDFVAVSLR